MSTIKVNKIENTSTTAGGVEIDTNGNVKAGGLQLPTAGSSASRNKIINGDFSVNQRRSYPITVTGSTNSGLYGLDRWRTGGLSGYTGTTAAAAYSHEGGPTNLGFRYAHKIAVTTPGVGGTNRDINMLAYRVEANDMYEAGYGTADAKSMVLSFYVKTNVPGTYGLFFYNITGPRMFIASYTVSGTDWQRIEVEIPGDTSGATSTTYNSEGLRIEWRSSCAGTNVGAPMSGWGAVTSQRSVTGNVDFYGTSGGTWEITGVQLEIGSKATEYERTSFQDSLRNCQRYYEHSNNFDENNWRSQSWSTADGVVTMSGSNGYSDFWPHYQTKRVNPSITIYSATGVSGNGAWERPGVQNNTNFTVQSVTSITKNQCLVRGVTPNPDSYVYSNWEADAEL